MVRGLSSLVILFGFGLFYQYRQSKIQQQQIPFLIENYYANRTVNDLEKKQRVLESLKKLNKDNPLTESSFGRYRELINQMGDGHLRLIKNENQENMTNHGLEYFFGSELLRSCLSCNPVLNEDKYAFERINDLPIEDWLHQNQYSVSASSDQGRRYRVLRSVNIRSDVKKITVLDSSHQRIEVYLSENTEKSSQKCVESVRLNDRQVLLKLKSFWCSEANEDRALIFNRFKDQFNKAIGIISRNDEIILDLRENGGGGDDELIFALSYFLKSKTKIYEFQYLKKTHYGSMKYWDRLWNSSQIWQERESGYLNQGTTSFINSLKVLVGPGCFSSCDLMAAILQDQKRGVLIGETTHGGVGDPFDYPLNEKKFQITIPGCLVWRVNGQLIEGVGVSPDIVYKQDLKSLQDDVLLKAVSL